MSKAGFTEEQNAAVDARNTAVLVSAAAGSGKTSVLTQRLLQRICEGDSVDRFLVITFTRAAAAELRGRILKGLSEIAAQQPDNAHIRRQTALLYRAQIGTIDSFCANVVRENAHLAGVSPAFATADNERAEALLGKAADEVIERAYTRIYRDDGLRLLVNSLGAGRDDSKLRTHVLELYRQLQSRAWPQQWAEQAVKQLDVSGLTDVGQTPWGEYLLQRAAAGARSCALSLERASEAVEACGEKKLIDAYIPDFEAFADAFRAIETACAKGWDAAAAAIGGYTVPRAPSPRKPEHEDVRDAAKAVRKMCKDKLDAMADRFRAGSADHLRDIQTTAPALRALVQLVGELTEEYARRKRRADLLDFSDAEHFCLQMLCDPDDPEKPSELARTLSARFCEVMVDEYQDVNAVQNSIFLRVSDEGHKLFMVGDVKQSIYRFRLAEPGIFNKTYADFASGENGLRILLRANFRSRASVLAACNSVFEKIMSRDLGEIEYNDEARLVARAAYPEEGEVRPELVLVSPDPNDSTAENGKLCEARWVAARIRKMLDEGEPVYDAEAKAMRPIRRGDIAVLMRTPGSSGAVYHKALAEQGIVSVMDRGESFLMLPEVSFALQMMAVADNPHQDIPLVAALRGAPFAFTPDELARIRAEAGKADLWDALQSRAQTDERCADFIALVRELRDAAADEPMQALLQRLYNRTGLMACCAALPDGEERAAGLMRLYDYACRFEKTETRGLNRFTAWLAMLEKNGMKEVSGGGADSVRIMSIHKSKGLEFPVVFLVDNGHKFRDDSDSVLCHTDLGLGMKLTDAERGLSWPTLVWTAIKQKKHMEELSEQQRVLYVAMTRAKERLIMTCASPSDTQLDTMTAVHAGQPGPIDPEELAGASRAGDWLVRAALRDGGQSIALHSEYAPARPQRQEEVIPDMTAQSEDAAVLADRLAWRYPYADAVPLPSKLTATELKEPEIAAPEDADIEAAPMVLPEARERIFRLPDLAGQERPLTGPERGTAAHLVMQFIDYAKTGSGEEIYQEIQRMRAGGLLDDRQADSVSVQDIRAFFASPIGQRLAAAAQLHREFRFSLLCPATLWYSQAREREEILLQGVIDCWFVEDDGITLLDFKTDGAIVPEHYAAQIGAYAYALRRITGLPVKRAVLWYLRRRRAVDMPVPET